MTTTTTHNGYILHEDASRVIIATGFKRKSSNIKTGGMVQVWILVRNVHPVEAKANGKDRLICGNCPLRKDACYVRVEQAPAAVWKGYKRGIYPTLTDYSVFAGRKVRLGAYGDPTHIPLEKIKAILAHAAGWTGYTHQWRNGLLAGYRPYLMASVESGADQCQAVSDGWRTFRVKRDWQPLFADELMCVNTTHGIQCADCGLCQGSSKRAKCIVIDVHGSTNVNRSILN